MLFYYFRRFMMWLGYRHVFYTPGRHGLQMSDFWLWHYAPKTEKRDYTEKEWHPNDELYK